MVKGTLPNKAIIAFKDEGEWQLIDDSLNFEFPLHSSDSVEVITKKARILGYFVSCHRGTGSIDTRIHDLDNKTGENGILKGTGVRTALSFRKYQIGELGKEIRPRRLKKRLPAR